jgi:hypothetical protein
LIRLLYKVLVALIEKWENYGVSTFAHDADATVWLSENLGHSISGGVELYGVQEFVLEQLIVVSDFHIVRVVVFTKEGDSHKSGSIH